MVLARVYRQMVIASLGLFLVTACGNTIHDEGVARLIPAIEQTGSNRIGFAEDRRFEVDMPDGSRIKPVPLIEPGAVPIRRAPGSRVYLAGSADGEAPVVIDDFLIIEIEEPERPSGVRQFVAGDIGPVRRQGIPVDNIAPVMPLPPQALDLTPYIPACITRMVGAVPMDLGTIAETSHVYVIVDYPPQDWAKQSCAGE
ncbi:MAG: hypothetical protein AAF213_05855 [Pseudomonadota bacterium]